MGITFGLNHACQGRIATDGVLLKYPACEGFE